MTPLYLSPLPPIQHPPDITALANSIDNQSVRINADGKIQAVRG